MCDKTVKITVKGVYSQKGSLGSRDPQCLVFFGIVLYFICVFSSILVAVWPFVAY